MRKLNCIDLDDMADEFSEMFSFESDDELIDPTTSKRKGEHLENEQEKKAYHDQAISESEKEPSTQSQPDQTNEELLKQRPRKEVAIYSCDLGQLLGDNKSLFQYPSTMLNV